MIRLIKKITSQSTNSSSFSKVLKAQICFALIPLLLVSLLSYFISQNIVNKQIIRLNKSTYGQIEDNISNLADSIYKLVSIISLDATLISNLQKDFSQNKAQYFLTSEEISNIMSIYSMPIFDASPLFTAVSENNTAFSYNITSKPLDFNALKQKNWYADLKASDYGFIWLTENPGYTESGHYLTAVKSLSNQFTKNQYGILLISIREEYFYNKYKAFLDGNTAIDIIDNNGNFISSSKRNRIGTVAEDNFISNIADKSMNGISIERRGSIIKFISKIDRTSWYCVYTIDTNTNLSDIYTLRTWFIVFLVLGLLMYYALSILIIRIFTKPLVQLNNKLQRYLITIPDVDTNQIQKADKYGNYDLLILTLDKTLMEIKNQENERHKAEMHAMQMQINPHFISNTLNTIKCLYWTGRSEQIVPITDALINLFRRSIGNLDEMVTVREELDCIKSYVAIQEIRNDYPITLSMHISPLLSEEKIPKLILQPIVENAVFHGIEPKNRAGSITIFVTRSDTMLVIEIDDDGVGFNIGTADALDTKIKNGHLHGIGISNIKNRLALIYNNMAQFSIKSTVGSGTQVILQLPLSQKTKEKLNND